MTPFDQTPWYETLLATLDKAAQTAAYDYDKWVSKDDLYQDAWVWALEHPLLVAQHLDKPTPDAGYLRNIVVGYLRMVGQREKARQSGYSPDDAYHYTPRMVAELLRASMDIVAEMEPSVGPADDEGGRSSAQDGQGDYLCSLFDVRNAWIGTAFRDDEARLIEARYVDDMEWHNIAASFGHDVEEVKRRVAVGLRRMTEFLGGFAGRYCPASCPDCTTKYDDEKGD